MPLKDAFVSRLRNGTSVLIAHPQHAEAKSVVLGHVATELPHDLFSHPPPHWIVTNPPGRKLKHVVEVLKVIPRTPHELMRFQSHSHEASS